MSVRSRRFAIVVACAVLALAGVNLDIGGGTTKLALVESGKVIATAAVHIGGRLQVVDSAGRITRLDPAGRAHARRAGFDWQCGSDTRDQTWTVWPN